ncbi:hypothetical protein F5X68DRAFT_197863 [Plectosphaerella plurivora]|uniref:Yeast cell wall synthesis Kre9/Knh1-like N-terminal domain-containing protein n=1 Tax=Plectosphaerella plurivora TaxID=936078 RepID=A0A9P8VJG1_9PEZI|nr:hypothetical protein F5X68DRAFT_197863 [Plectosphaerella plurivora]
MARLTLATLVAALASLAQAVILTNSEFNVVAGESFTIEWAEAAGPVTLRLKSGPEGNLVTVQEITSGQTGTSFVWQVPTGLASGQYAFEIEDGTAINYSLQFPIAGDGSAVTGASSATGSAATSAGSASASASVTVTATVTPSSAVSVSTVVSTTAAASSSGAASSTAAISSSDDSSAVTSAVTNGTSTRTTVTRRPSATTSSTDDSEASQVPDSGASSNMGSAVLAAVIGLGALFMAY